MRFTLKQLEYFVAAAEAGSITAAAERVHISAPSISVAITQLEQELGVDLFLRQKAQGLSLTQAGEKVLAQAREILKQTATLHDLASTAGSQMKGKLTIGCLTTLAPLLLPELCIDFRRSHPDVEIVLVEGSQDQLISQARRGQIDVAITYAMHIANDVRFDPLVKLAPKVIVGEGHHLAGASSVDLRDIADDPYILLDLPYSRDYFFSVYRAVGMEPKIAYRTTQQEVVRSMVANNMGVGIAVSRPRSQYALDGKRVIYIDISNPVPRLTIGLLAPQQNETRLVAEFKDFCRLAVSSSHIPGMS